MEKWFQHIRELDLPGLHACYPYCALHLCYLAEVAIVGVIADTQIYLRCQKKQVSDISALLFFFLCTINPNAQNISNLYTLRFWHIFLFFFFCELNKILINVKQRLH